LCALVAGTQMTWGLVVPVLPVYADRLGAGPAALGVVVAAFGLGRLVIDIPAGAVAQRFDQRRLLVAAAAIVVLVTLLTALATSLEQLIFLRLLTGLSGGVVMTTGQALLSGTDPARMGRTMAALQTCHGVGGALGPALGGLVVGIDDRLPFVVGGAALIGLVLVAVWKVPPALGRLTAASSEGSSPLWSPGLVGICVVGFAVFFVRFGGQQFLIPVLAYQRAGLSPAELGLWLAAVTVLGIVLVGLAGALTDRWGRRRMVVATITLLGLAVLGFLGSRNQPVFLVALVLTGLFLTFSGPPTGAYLAESAAPDRRALAIGVQRTFGDAATLIGPPVLGWLVAAGFTNGAVAVLATTAVAAGGLFAFFTRSRMTTRSAEPVAQPSIPAVSATVGAVPTHTQKVPNQ
jgi:MFS family permease